jgi:hypothetical protein
MQFLGAAHYQRNAFFLDLDGKVKPTIFKE